MAGILTAPRIFVAKHVAITNPGEKGLGAVELIDVIANYRGGIICSMSR